MLSFDQSVQSYLVSFCSYLP